MLQCVHAQPGENPSIMLHPMDKKREFAYDSNTDLVFPYARDHNHLIIDIARDWKRVFPGSGFRQKGM